MRRLPALGVVFVLCLICLSGTLHAQSTDASLTGYVTDPSKQIIVGAKVVVINTGTNIRYEAATNNAGSYFITMA